MIGVLWLTTHEFGPTYVQKRRCYIAPLAVGKRREAGE